MVDAAQAGVKHMNIDYKSSKRGIAFWVVLSLFVLISIILIAATPDILPAILDKAEVLGLGTNDSLVYN
jgi:hypothetical protein